MDHLLLHGRIKKDQYRVGRQKAGQLALVKPRLYLQPTKFLQQSSLTVKAFCNLSVCMREAQSILGTIKSCWGMLRSHMDAREEANGFKMSFPSLTTPASYLSCTVSKLNEIQWSGFVSSTLSPNL